MANAVTGNFYFSDEEQERLRDYAKRRGLRFFEDESVNGYTRTTKYIMRKELGIKQ
jgi:hypothetical protein